MVFLLFIVAAVWSVVQSARNIAGFVNKLPASGLLSGTGGSFSIDGLLAQFMELSLPPALVDAALNSGQSVLGSRQAAAEALTGVLRTATTVGMARRGGNWLLAQAHIAPSLFDRLSTQPARLSGGLMPTSVAWQSAGAQVVATATFQVVPHGTPISQLKILGQTVSTSYGTPTAIEDWVFTRAANGPSTCQQCGALDGVVNGVCRYCKAVTPTAGNANDFGGWVLADLRERPAAAA